MCHNYEETLKTLKDKEPELLQSGQGKRFVLLGAVGEKAAKGGTGLMLSLVEFDRDKAIASVVEGKLNYSGVVRYNLYTIRRKDAGQAVGQSGDGGVDGIIKEDKLGFEIIYIQAKKWKSKVGRPVVQAFAGSLEGLKAKKGVLITTSQFSKEAREYVNLIEKKIILIDGEQLAEWMIEYDVGVAEIDRYIVKKVDFDYFDEDSLI